MKRRTSLCVAVALSAVVAGASVSDATPVGPVEGPPRMPSPPTTTLAATVPLDCTGEARAVTVSATVPRTIVTGQAFPLTTRTAGLERPATVHVSLSNATPDTASLHVGERPNTTQHVGHGTPGRDVTLRVTGATYLDVTTTYPVGVPRATTVSCTPTGDTLLGSVTTIGGARPAPATTTVDADLHLECTLFWYWPVGDTEVRVSFAAPTRLTTGQVFTLPDLAFEHEPFLQRPRMSVSGATAEGGADPGYVSATSTQTVSAAPGESIRLEFGGLEFTLGLDTPQGVCTPVGSGHLATIPVVEG